MSRTYRYTAFIEPDQEEGGYVVTVPDLPGCVTQGETFDEAIAMAKDAITLYIESLRDLGRPVPQGHEYPGGTIISVAA
jgi:antitoxin HicB